MADLSFHKPADMVTCPVLYKPMARAAAGDRSMSLPRTQGPRSLMRTVTQPLWQTRIWVPNGSLRWAAVIAAQFSRSPLAVLWPQRPSDPPYMLATSACAVRSKNSSITAAMRPEQTSPFMRLPLSHQVESNLGLWIEKSCGISWIDKVQKLGKPMRSETSFFQMR